MPEFWPLVRAPLWLILVLLVAAIGVGIYAYYTTPLPLGLGTLVSTPGGEAAATPIPVSAAATPGARTPPGQPLVLGAASVSVQSVQPDQDLTANNRGGPPGVFTVVDLVIQNAGTQPLTPKASDFQLLDSSGRVYAVDPDATRSVNTTARHRVLFDASVPPSASVESLIAFETPTGANGLVLRVTGGYGDLELPR